MNSPTYCGGFCIKKVCPPFIVPQALLSPICFLMLACALLLLSGCAATQDSSYSPAAALSSPPPDVRVSVSSANQVQHSNVVSAAQSTIGSPYRFGGSTPETGFDCSGLVCWAYEQVGVRVPRRAQDQLYAGSKVLSKSELRPGDIVVFKGTNNRTGWHSGIYTGNGQFVHSPRSGKNVTESSLNEEYFARRFAGGSRVAPDNNGLMAAAYAPASQMLERQNMSAPAVKSARKTPAAKAESVAQAKPAQTASAKGKGAKTNAVLVADAKKGKQGKASPSVQSSKAAADKKVAAAKAKKPQGKALSVSMEKKGKQSKALAASKGKDAKSAAASKKPAQAKKIASKTTASKSAAVAASKKQKPASKAAGAASTVAAAGKKAAAPGTDKKQAKNPEKKAGAPKTTVSKTKQQAAKSKNG